MTHKAIIRGMDRQLRKSIPSKTNHQMIERRPSHTMGFNSGIGLGDEVEY